MHMRGCLKREKWVLGYLIVTAFVQGCCGPNSCPQAKTGASVLGKAIGEIESYKERNGRYPVQLDNIKAGFALEVELELKRACQDCSLLQYKTDSFGYELEYQYPHMGKNRCIHNNEMEQWECKGIY